MLGLFGSQGIEFDEIFICPHLPDDNCDCRKPRTGLLTRYLAANSIDLAASAVIGDRQTDMELAERIGVDGILVNSADEGGPDLAANRRPAVLLGPQRPALRATPTRPASAHTVNLDTSGQCQRSRPASASSTTCSSKSRSTVASA